MNKDKCSSVLQADTQGEHNQKCILTRMVTWGQQWPRRWCGRCPAGLQWAARGWGLSLLPLSAPPAAPALPSKAREGKSLKYFLQWLEPRWVLCVLVDGKVNESAVCSGSSKGQLYHPGLHQAQHCNQTSWRDLEDYRLTKTSKITQSNHPPSTNIPPLKHVSLLEHFQEQWLHKFPRQPPKDFLLLNLTKLINTENTQLCMWFCLLTNISMLQREDINCFYFLRILTPISHAS